MTDRIQEIADELLGTNQDVSEVMDSYELDDLSLCSELDEYALQCTACRWWFVPEEMDTTEGDCICGECFEDA